MNRNSLSIGHVTRQHRWLLRASALAFACAALTTPAIAQNAPANPKQQQSVEMQTYGVPAWGLTNSDLPADPSVRFGVLPNGMRYALKRNVTPKGAAVIRFAFNVGMRDVEPEQGGAAHFLEHMAFNGSTNIPEGELVKRLERLGLAFGADTNAQTGLEQTTYKLDLPNTNPETVDSALTFMREIASELTLNKDAVDRERGVLLSEFRVRNVPAALYKALGGFATNGVNMSKLESYMVNGEFAATQFLADVDGHPEDPALRRALEELEFFSREVKILGVYPAHPFRLETQKAAE